MMCLQVIIILGLRPREALNCVPNLRSKASKKDLPRTNTPGACTIKTFYCNNCCSIIKLAMATASHFHPSLVFAGKDLGYQSKTPYGTHCSWLSALPPNVRLGWKWVTLANTLACSDMAAFTALNVFKHRPSLILPQNHKEENKFFLTLIPKEGSHGHIQCVNVEEGEDTYGCLLEVIWKKKTKTLIKKL